MNRIIVLKLPNKLTGKLVRVGIEDTGGLANLLEEGFAFAKDKRRSLKSREAKAKELVGILKDLQKQNKIFKMKKQDDNSN